MYNTIMHFVCYSCKIIIIIKITSIALKSSGGPSSEVQQNKIINHIQEPGTYRGHHEFKGPPTVGI